MSWRVGHPIKRDGTNQLQRLLDALRPERNPVDGRRVEDLLLFIYCLADQFAFYNERNEWNPKVEEDGNWTAFFAALRDSSTGQVTTESIRLYLSKAEQHSDNPVFLSILLAFLHLFGHLQKDANTLTQKHLDFYYEQVLGFRRLPPVPDEVHVLLELAPHIRQHPLPAGTALKAGKDALGKPLTYVTNRDIVVNKAKLSAIKTALITTEGRVFAAEMANSADGLGAPIESTPLKWPLFGDPNSMQASAIGLAIASPLLLLEEVRRRLIKLTLTFEEIPEALIEDDFRCFRAFGSGQEGWVPISENTEKKLSIDHKKNQVLFSFALEHDQPALTAYNRQVLAGNLDTDFPVMQLLIGDQPNKYDLLRILVLKKVDLKVEVMDESNQPSVPITPGQPDSNGRLYHLQPFGSEEITSPSQAYLMPEMPQAALYLGFAGFDPPQNLHLLFQIAEGSAESTTVVGPEDIQWHYLTDRGWRGTALSGSEIFIDTTRGLQKSGIMAFQIGRDAGKNATQLPGGLHWLRASIQKDPAAAARALAIHTQAITAVFQENGNDPAHLFKPLSEGALTALVERSSAIRKVVQPYSSFGGSPAEPDQRFYTRVSERLRHKQRAVTLWDIERLTLQQFPALYEVKAIPHTGLDENKFYSEFQPGQVTVVLVPQLRNRNVVNILQPRASSALMEEVRRYLQPLCMPFAWGAKALQVVNPRYEPVMLSFSVGFRSGYDSGYYADVLQEALRRRLSPWAYEEGEDIRFGGRVYKSQLLAFVEEQAYVDYVTDFKMVHARAEPGVGEMTVDTDLFVYFNSPERDTDVAIASTAASILVSADRHRIQTLQPDEFRCDNPEDTCNGGIGCWYVDIDFMVSEL